jgi:hypothetical protein
MKVRMPSRAQVTEYAVPGPGRMTSYEVRSARRANMKVTIIGAGNMGRVLATGWWLVDTA